MEATLLPAEPPPSPKSGACRPVHAQAPANHLWRVPAAYAALGVLAAACFLPALGAYAPLDPTDSFFIESAREMLETGQWLLPMNNYAQWLDKPILIFWAVLASYKAFGVSAFTARLASALPAIALTLLIFHHCRRYTDLRTALFASLIFLGMPLASVIGHICLSDMLLSFLLAGGFLNLFKRLTGGSLLSLLVGYVYIGLAVLCKGPVALLLTGCVVLAYLGASSQNLGRIWQKIWALHPIVGLIVVAAINGPWYWAAAQQTNGLFTHTFFVTQNFGRMTGQVNHQEPFWFYIPVLLGGLFPWSMILADRWKLLPRIWRRRLMPGKVSQLLLFCLAWAATVIAGFSCISTKLPTYILPALPAVAIMGAFGLTSIVRNNAGKRLLWTGVIPALAAVVFVAMNGRFHGLLRLLFDNFMPALALMLIAICLYAAFLAARKTKAAMCTFIVTGLAGCAILVPAGLTSFYKDRQVGFDGLTKIAAQDGRSVAMLIAEQPSIPYYTHKKVNRMQLPNDVTVYEQHKEEGWLFVPNEIVDRLRWFKESKITFVARAGKWRLYSVTPCASGKDGSSDSRR